MASSQSGAPEKEQFGDVLLPDSIMELGKNELMSLAGDTVLTSGLSALQFPYL